VTCQNGPPTILLESYDLTVTVRAVNNPPESIKRNAVGAQDAKSLLPRLAGGLIRLRRIAGKDVLGKDRHAPIGIQLVDDTCRQIAEYEISYSAIAYPHGTVEDGVSFVESFQLCIWRDKRVDMRVEPEHSWVSAGSRG
jgi:hypothetical protein